MDTAGSYVPSPIQWVRRRELYARTYATIDRRSSHLGAVGPAPRRAAAEQLVSNTDDYNGERSDDRLQTDPISQRRLAHVDALRMPGAAPHSVHRAASNAQRARSASAGPKWSWCVRRRPRRRVAPVGMGTKALTPCRTTLCGWALCPPALSSEYSEYPVLSYAPGLAGQ